MKTKMLIILPVAIALLAACKGKSSKDYEVNRNVRDFAILLLRAGAEMEIR